MSDWISELKEAVDVALRYNEDVDKTATGLIYSIDMIIGEYGWHPVSEKPDKEGYYIVSFSVLGKEPKVAIIFLKEPFQFYEMYGWMPLPEPYKSEINKCSN